MNTNEEELKAWWDEVDRLVKEMTPPLDPNPPPKPISGPPPHAKWSSGISFYTLKSDRQFPVESTHLNSQGWNYG